MILMKMTFHAFVDYMPKGVYSHDALLYIYDSLNGDDTVIFDAQEICDQFDEYKPEDVDDTYAAEVIDLDNGNTLIRRG